MVHEHPLFQKGIAEFQSGAFYPCHDTLEALWMDLMEPDRTFVQGILQIAVACYHLGNANERGAMILLGEGIKRLKEYRPSYETINVTHFVQTSAQFLSLLQTIEPEQLAVVCDWAKTASEADKLSLRGLDETVQFPQLTML